MKIAIFVVFENAYVSQHVAMVGHIIMMSEFSFQETLNLNKSMNGDSVFFNHQMIFACTFLFSHPKRFM